MPSKKKFRGGKGKALMPAKYISRSLAEEIVKSGQSPLHIMWDNMIFWANQVGELTSDIRKMIVDCEDEEQRAEAFGMLKRMLLARENAQRCAVDMAPYCHPKLMAIETKNEDDKELNEALLPSDPIEASRVYQKLIGGPSGG